MVLFLLLLLLVDCWVLLLVGCYSECCSAWFSLWSGLVWVADAFLFLLFLLLYVLSWASGLATALGATLLLVEVAALSVALAATLDVTGVND